MSASKQAELRTRCSVTLCHETDAGVEVSYVDGSGSNRHIKGQILIGADGKRGHVRKNFLESRGIFQETGV